jgi:hypothetical protein
LSEKGFGKSHFGIILVWDLEVLQSQPFATASIMDTKQDPKESILLMAFVMILHTRLCRSMMFACFDIGISRFVEEEQIYLWRVITS